MTDFLVLIALLFFIIFIVSLLSIAVCAAKNKKVKPPILRMGICLAVCVISIASARYISDKKIEQANKEKQTTVKVDEAKKEEPKEEVKTEEAKKKETKTEQENPKKEETIQEKIENEIHSLKDRYSTLQIDRITINENLGTEDIKDDYIVLVYMRLAPQTEKTGNEISEMFANDVAGNFIEKGFKNIAEIAVFYEDKHNNRNLKYSYEYTGTGFKKVK